MASLTGSTIASSYTSLLKLNGNTDNIVAGNGSNAIQIVDGDGTASPLYLNTDRLGIGGQPSKALTVQGASGQIANITNGSNNLVMYVDNSNVQIANNTDLNAEKINMSTANNAIEFYQGGSEKMTLTSTGLNIAGTATITGALIDLRASTDTDSEIIFREGSTAKAVIFNDASANSLSLSDGSGNLSPVLNIYSGSVGIGTASPSQALEINKSGANLKVVSDANVYLSLDSTQTNGDEWQIFNANSGSTSTLQFKNIDQSKLVMVMDETGGVGIGSAPDANTPLHIKNTTYGRVRIESTGSESFAILYLKNDDTEYALRTTSAEAFEIRDEENSAVRLAIESDGTANQQGNYIVNEQGRQNHVANTMSSPYYRFDGTNDLINIGNEANLNLNTNLSISVWAKFPSATITGVNGLFGKWDSVSGSGNQKGYFFAVLDDEKLYFYTSSNGTNATAVSSPVLTDLDKWNHFIVTYNAGAITFYRNGVSIGTGTGESSIFASSANAYIGAYQAGANFFNGEMSKVQVFNNTLTATEVKELYSGASVPFKYKGANQTGLLSGNDGSFTSGAGNWTAEYLGGGSGQGSGVFTMVGDGNWDNMKRDNTLEVGRAYNLSVYLQRTGDGPDVTIRAGCIDGTTDNYFEMTSTGTQTLHTGTFVAKDTTLRIGLPSSAGGFSGTTLTIDSLSLKRAGAVAEYDGSSAGSKVWGDKSGNDLHGTVGAGTLDATAPTLENTPYDAGTEYEEGTFTPTIVSSGGVTLTAGSGNTAQYVRVGNKVTCNGFVIVNGLNSATTSHTISLHGLPYAGRSGNRTAVAFGNNEGMAMTDGDNMQGIIYDTNSTISLYVNDATGSNATNMLVSEWSDDGRTYFSVTYFV